MKTKDQLVKLYCIYYKDTVGVSQVHKCWTKKKLNYLLRTLCRNWYRWEYVSAYQYN